MNNTKLNNITAATVILTILIVQAPHLQAMISELSHYTGLAKTLHSWAIAIMIEAIIVVLAANKKLWAASIVMLISSLFVIGFYFDDGFVLTFSSSAMVLFSIAMPFISKTLGDSFFKQKAQEEDKVEKPKKEPSSPLSAKVWTLYTKGGLSMRQVAQEVNLSKSQVGRMIKEMRTA